MANRPVKSFETYKLMVFPRQLANLKSKENADARVVPFDMVSLGLWTGYQNWNRQTK